MGIPPPRVETFLGVNLDIGPRGRVQCSGSYGQGWFSRSAMRPLSSTFIIFATGFRDPLTARRWAFFGILFSNCKNNTPPRSAGHRRSSRGHMIRDFFLPAVQGLSFRGPLFRTLNAPAIFIHTAGTVDSMTNTAFGHDIARITFIALLASGTNKLRITHFPTSCRFPSRDPLVCTFSTISPKPP